MNRRSFLQAMAAIVGLPTLFGGKKPCTEKRYWFNIQVPDKLELEFNRSYFWQEVTLEFDPNGRVLSASKNPGGRFHIAEHQRNTETVLWER